MFHEKYLKATKEKGSLININLDPALPKQRKENIVPNRYTTKEDTETLLNFSLDIIEQVSDYCCSIKPNTQYYLGHTKILKKITPAATKTMLSGAYQRPWKSRRCSRVKLLTCSEVPITGRR